MLPPRDFARRQPIRQRCRGNELPAAQTAFGGFRQVMPQVEIDEFPPIIQTGNVSRDSVGGTFGNVRHYPPPLPLQKVGKELFWANMAHRVAKEHFFGETVRADAFTNGERQRKPQGILSHFSWFIFRIGFFGF